MVMEKDEEPGPPKWLQLYRSLFTLLLAIFITMATLGPEKNGTPGFIGMGSMMQGMWAGGAGGVFQGGGGGPVDAQTGPRYKAPEGQEDPPTSRRIDPEMEEAQRAAQDLDKKFGVRSPHSDAGYNVVLFTPCAYTPGGGGLSPDKELFLADMAPLLENVMLGQGFVVSIAVCLPADLAGDPHAVSAALAAAQQIRGQLAANMSQAGGRAAGRQMYCYLQIAQPQEGTPAPTARQFPVQILLTKPTPTKLAQSTP
jgi:hypothetical protein